MRYEGETLRDRRLNVEGNEFINCNIADCVTWTFEGPAEVTLKWLHGLYHGFGDGGREQVENIFAAIRRR